MKKLVLLAIICCSLLIPSGLLAQDPGLPCDGADPWEECPIDADIGFLIAGGIAIGWFALKKNMVRV